MAFETAINLPAWLFMPDPCGNGMGYCRCASCTCHYRKSHPAASPLLFLPRDLLRQDWDPRDLELDSQPGDPPLRGKKDPNHHIPSSWLHLLFPENRLEDRIGMEALWPTFDIFCSFPPGEKWRRDWVTMPITAARPPGTMAVDGQQKQRKMRKRVLKRHFSE